MPPFFQSPHVDILRGPITPPQLKRTRNFLQGWVCTLGCVLLRQYGEQSRQTFFTDKIAKVVVKPTSKAELCGAFLTNYKSGTEQDTATVATSYMMQAAYHLRQTMPKGRMITAQSHIGKRVIHDSLCIDGNYFSRVL